MDFISSTFKWWNLTRLSVSTIGVFHFEGLCALKIANDIPSLGGGIFNPFPLCKMLQRLAWSLTLWHGFRLARSSKRRLKECHLAISLHLTPDMGDNVSRMKVKGAPFLATSLEVLLHASTFIREPAQSAHEYSGDTSVLSKQPQKDVYNEKWKHVIYTDFITCLFLLWEIFPKSLRWNSC